ncbi:FO synthase [Gordonia sp. NPDC003376]
MVMRAWAEDSVVSADPVGTDEITAALDGAAADPAALTDPEWIALLHAGGEQLEQLCSLADDARRRVTDPDALTFVVNRNLDTSALAGLSRPGPTVEELVVEAADLGATEICMQGPVPADAPAETYIDLIARITTAAPMHLHAYRAPEMRDAAARLGISVAEFVARAKDAGLGSAPGTAAQVLDDDLRAALAPDGVALPVSDWVETIETVHAAGLFTTATLLYGHLETPAQQIAHLRTLIEIQARTGGFSELIVMPMLPQNAPPHLAAQAVHTVSTRETRAVHAVARLITLGAFDHLQVAWTKLEPAIVELLLRGGADDIGGLLLDGELMPTAGAEAGRVLDVDTLVALAERLDRAPRQRTTAYGRPDPDRCLDLDRTRVGR